VAVAGGHAIAGQDLSDKPESENVRRFCEVVRIAARWAMTLRGMIVEAEGSSCRTRRATALLAQDQRACLRIA